MITPSCRDSKYLLVIICLLAIIPFIPTNGFTIEQAPVAAGQLVKRLLPKYASRFVFEQIKTPGDSDTFEME